MVPSEDYSKEIEELKSELERVKAETPKGTESLQQGEEKFKVNFSYKIKDTDFLGETTVTKSNDSISLSWNQIFYAISPSMIGEAAEYYLNPQLAACVKSLKINQLKEKHPIGKFQRFSISDVDFQTILVQLRAPWVDY